MVIVRIFFTTDGTGMSLLTTLAKGMNKDESNFRESRLEKIK
jgi:hypothetical protein